MGPGCCRLCLCSYSWDQQVSKRVKDQPTSASVWDVTVSISKNPKHKPLLGTRENLAILIFPAFLGVPFFFFLSKVRRENSLYCLLKYIIAMSEHKSFKAISLLMLPNEIQNKTPLFYSYVSCALRLEPWILLAEVHPSNDLIWEPHFTFLKIRKTEKKSN